MRHSLDEQHDDARRAFLVRALSLGLLAGGSGWQLEALAGIFGDLPGRLPEGRSIFSLKGEVLVNGQPATRETLIGPQDRLRTGPGASLVAVVGQDALILRERSELQLDAGRAVRQFFRLVSGAMLTVFGQRDRELAVQTPTATIGIRGTGVYFEVDPEKTYVCTCYGRVRIAAAGDPQQREEIVARHHDAPRYVLAKPQDGRLIVPAGFQDHTDLELMTLEALVGRTVPFTLEQQQYQAPRREY